jgi:hypothetical protein
MSFHETFRPGTWLTLPLCGRYVVVHFNLVWVPQDAADQAAAATTICAIGTLIDGQHELMGAWFLPPEGSGVWPDVLSELWERGVEQIDWAVVSGQPAPSAGDEAGSPRIHYWLDESTLISPTVVLSPRMKRVLAMAHDRSQRLQAAMTRSARRRGGQFGSPESAFACMVQHWKRMERQFGAGATGRHHWAAGPGSPATAGADVAGSVSAR